MYPVSKPLPRPPLLGPRAAEARKSDPFHILSVNPIDEVLNDDLVRRYVTQMGKIKTRADTALTWKNQRRVGKMVRRARAMGLISRWTNERT
jgi:small subunit ribosomal protein S18